MMNRRSSIEEKKSDDFGFNRSDSPKINLKFDIKE
jgi:hypothetical protein